MQRKLSKKTSSFLPSIKKSKAEGKQRNEETMKTSSTSGISSEVFDRKGTLKPEYELYVGLKDIPDPADIEIFALQDVEFGKLDRYFNSVKTYFFAQDEGCHSFFNEIGWKIEDATLTEEEIMHTELMPAKQTEIGSVNDSTENQHNSGRKRKLTLADLRSERLEDFVSEERLDILNKYFNSVQNLANEPEEKRLCSDKSISSMEV
ncbi:unnamed protein product [Dimorphilus gyrociliatus]|uniref:Uncharacterized protein n=1 Tax=Dimorphilus gyrociliatus TaxID=2664684 RepID=A0A7I8V5S5_9ANNE|nr:unnamed protein product [Dimorphilus gyrociliatus]